MPFEIIRNDITKMDVDAIVNAASTYLKMGGGVCGAIFRAAGIAELQKACDQLAPINTGDAVITPGFRLPAKYIIHTAGPIYIDGRHGEEVLLRSCYENSLKLAKEAGCESIAFPLIASGTHRFPKGKALQVATAAIVDFLLKEEMIIYLVVFDRAAFKISEKLLGKVRAYIDEHYVYTAEELPRLAQERFLDYQVRETTADLKRESCSGILYSAPDHLLSSLDKIVDRLDESFSQTLLKLIDSKGKTDVEVYKKANIDRRHFSKIRSNASYTPSKRTVLALAIALELTLPQTNDLLRRAGYSLSHSSKFDVIIEYFIKNGIYDVFVINQVLFKYDQPLLGG